MALLDPTPRTTATAGTSPGDHAPARRPIRALPARDLPGMSATPEGAPGVDPLVIGRRIRHVRTACGLTLDALGARIGRAASQISVLENGHREPRLSVLQQIAEALDVPLGDLLAPEAPSRRAALEVALERAQRGPLFAALQLPPVRVGRSLPTDALETIVRLQQEVQRLLTEKAATPEEARRANAELRAEMRARDNWFGELEAHAADLLAAVGHPGGPLSQRGTAEIAAHLGFALHYVPDLPHSTRSVTDLAHRRIYLPHAPGGSGDPRSALLQALAAYVLQHAEPRDYGDFLRQRVETNYLAAALMIPQDAAVAMLGEAKAARRLSVEDLRDAFAVTYETAAHRFTNLATRHLDIPVHFMKVHENGALHKAYENDGVDFPHDPLGAIEGQPVCRWWTARAVFAIPDRLSPYYQYTDTPTGTYWCTSRVQGSPEGEFSVSVGVPFAHVRWFRGRETTERARSACPDPACCRTPPRELADRWTGMAWPSARPHASHLATLPSGAFPGVDQTEVMTFLDRHAPADPA